MKSVTKRVISIVLMLGVLCGVFFTQVGFSCKKDPVIGVFGDFEILMNSRKYATYKNLYYVWGLSEQGRQSENLIIPIEIEGKILSCGGGGYGVPGPNYKDTFTNSKLKKLFLNDTKSYWENLGKDLYYYTHPRSNFLWEFTMSAYEKCSSFKKVLLNGFFYDIMDIDWLVDRGFYSIEYNKDDMWNRYTNKIYKYVNYKFFTTVLNGTIKNGEDAVYYETIDYKRTLVYHLDTVAEMESVLDYRTRFHWYSSDYLCFIKMYRLANVEFMYNYENSPTFGHYWIDDIENGEKIEVVPENPTREGYTFGGWYTESECVNEFDFDTPIVKREIDWGDVFEFKSEIPENYVTYIYARWIEK